MTRRQILSLLAVPLIVFVVLQLAPGGVDNPPVTAEPAWADAQTEALARRACFDCHSNETEVPWYGQIAPFRQVVANHVNDGRRHLNFSEMDRPQEEAHEAGEEVLEGEMPPRYYTLLHPEARLTQAERQALAAGLDATLGGERHARRDGHDEHEEHEEHDED